MKNAKTIYSSNLLGKILTLVLSEPHQYGELGTCKVAVVAFIQDDIDSEMYLVKPLDAPLVVLNKFKANLLAIGPMGGIKKEDRPAMPKLLQGQNVQVAVNFLEDGSFYKGQSEIKRSDLPDPKSVKFGCYAEASWDQ